MEATTRHRPLADAAEDGAGRSEGGDSTCSDLLPLPWSELDGVSPMVKRKRIPLRTCVSCGLKTAKRELLRDRVLVQTVRLQSTPAWQAQWAWSVPLQGVSWSIPESLKRGRLEHSLKARIGEEEWESSVEFSDNDRHSDGSLLTKGSRQDGGRGIMTTEQAQSNQPGISGPRT